MVKVALTSQTHNVTFSIDNQEHMLKSAQFNIIILNNKFIYNSSFTATRYSQLLHILKRKVVNNRIIAIIARPNYENGCGGFRFRKYLGCGNNSVNLNMQYWCYLGQKSAGQFTQLEFAESSEHAAISYINDRHDRHDSHGSHDVLSLGDKTKHKVVLERRFPDHVYVINRQNQPARLIQIDSVLNKLNIDYTTITATEGSNFNKQALSSGISLKNYGQLASLQQALQDAKNNNYQEFLLLADNLVLHTNFVKILERIMQLYGDWNILFLASSHTYKETCLDSKRLSLPSWKAMTIHQSCYNELIERCKDNKQTIKNLIHHCVHTFRCYTPRVLLALELKDMAKISNDYVTATLPRVMVITTTIKGSLSYNSIYQQDYPRSLIDVVTEDKGNAQIKINLAENCYLPYNFVSQAVLLGCNQLIDGLVEPRCYTLKGCFESNILGKLAVKDLPLFKTAREADQFDEKGCTISTNKLHHSNIAQSCSLHYFYDQMPPDFPS